MLSVRFVSADHYMESPIPELDVGYSEFRGTEVKQVPLIRIFGSTTTGKKTCLHIHGVFPYIYIPYEGCGAHDKIMYQIASSLDKAINISLGKTNSNVQHIYKVALVSGIPFYGFHTKEHQFFKIYFYNPIMVKKATELLQSGAILNKIYQPHEAHIPYILQFMIDYNLYGMNLVNLANVKFRRDLENAGSFSTLSDEIFLPERVTKMSTCEIEVDAVAADIINRREISVDMAVNPGLAAIWEDEKQRLREEGRTSQLTPQASQDRLFVTSTESELFFKHRLHEILLNTNSQVSDNSSSNNPESASTPYPAETPKDSGLLEASFLDLHVQTRGLSSSTGCQHIKPDDDISVVDEYLVLSLPSSQRVRTLSRDESVLLNSQDMELADVLMNLENDASVDDDSVLGSQIAQEFGNETTSDDEDMQELSQPLNAEENSAENSLQENSEDRLEDDENETLWENTFWDDICNDIPQLDGADDVPHIPRRRRFGVRGKAVTPSSLTKPLLSKNSLSSVVDNQKPVEIRNKKKPFVGVAKLQSRKNFLSTESENKGDKLCDEAKKVCAEVIDDSKSSLNREEKRENGDDFVSGNNLSELNNENDHSVLMGSTETSFVGREPFVMENALLTMESDFNSISGKMENISDSDPAKLSAILIDTKDKNCHIDLGDAMTDVEERVSLVNDLLAVACDHVIVDDFEIGQNTVAEDVNPILVDAMKTPSELSETNIVCDVVEDAFLQDLAEVSEANVDNTCVLGLHCGSPSTELICRDFDSLELEESSNSELNFQPVSVVCCNTCTSSCTSEVSVHDLGMTDTVNNFDEDREDSEEFRQSVLIGDPSFTAQPGSSEGDDFVSNDLQVHDLFSNSSTSNTWLSSDQNSETSKSSYLSDIDAELLSQYDTEEIQEVSPEKSTENSEKQTSLVDIKRSQKTVRSTKISQSKRQTLSSELPIESEDLNCKSKSHLRHKRKVKAINRTLVTRQSSKCRNVSSLNVVTDMKVLPKLSLTVDTEAKDTLTSSVYSSVSSLSCTYKSPLDVSPVEVKRIETILWQGNMEDIIQQKDDMMKDGSSVIKRRVRNNKQMNSNRNSRVRNGQRPQTINGLIKKETSKIENSLRRKREYAVNNQTNVCTRLVHKSDLVLTDNSLLNSPSDLQICNVAGNEKYTNQLNEPTSDILLKKLAKKLQKEKRKKLSLSYRQKSPSTAAREQKKQDRLRRKSEESTLDISEDMCLICTKNSRNKDKCSDKGTEVSTEESAKNLSTFSDTEFHSTKTKVNGTIEKTANNVSRLKFRTSLSVCDAKGDDARNNSNLKSKLFKCICYEDKMQKVVNGCSRRKDDLLKSHSITNKEALEMKTRQISESTNSIQSCKEDKVEKPLFELKQEYKERVNNSENNDCYRSSVNISFKSKRTNELKDKDEDSSFQTTSILHTSVNKADSQIQSDHSKSGIIRSKLLIDTGNYSLRSKEIQKQGKVTCKLGLKASGLFSSKHLRDSTNSKLLHSLNKESFPSHPNGNKAEQILDDTKHVNTAFMSSSVKENNNVHSYLMADIPKLLNPDDKETKTQEQSSKLRFQKENNIKSSFEHVEITDKPIMLDTDELSKSLSHTNLVSDVKFGDKMKAAAVLKSLHDIQFNSNIKNLRKKAFNVNISCEKSQENLDNVKLKNKWPKRESHNNNNNNDNLHSFKSCIKPCFVRLERLPASTLSLTIAGDKVKRELRSTALKVQQACISFPLPNNFINVVPNGNRLINATADITRDSRVEVKQTTNAPSVQFISKQDRRLKQNNKSTKNSKLQKKVIKVVQTGQSKKSHCREKCVNSFHRKHLRRKSGNRDTQNESLDNVLQSKLNLANEIRPCSVLLEKLDQRILNKYSANLPGTSSDIRQLYKLNSTRKERKSMKGEEKGHTLCQKRNSRNKKQKEIAVERIPCVDGAFENTSSDDSSENKSSFFCQSLEKSPVPKRIKRQKSEAENNFSPAHSTKTGSNVSVSLERIKQNSITPTKNLTRRHSVFLSQTRSPSRSPRKNVYPPLAIKIQKSPSKRNVDSEGTNEETSSKTPDDSEQDSNFSKLRSHKYPESEMIDSKVKHATVAHIQSTNSQKEQSKNMCSIFRKRKRKSISCSPEPGYISHQMIAKVSVNVASSCGHVDTRTAEDQFETDADSSEDFISSVSKKRSLFIRGIHQIDDVQKFGICSISESSKISDVDNNFSDESACSFPLNNETKIRSEINSSVCSQTKSNVCNKNVSVLLNDVPASSASEAEEDIEHVLSIAETGYIPIDKQSNFSVLGKCPVSVPELETEKTESDNSQDFTKNNTVSRIKIAVNSSLVTTQCTKERIIDKERKRSIDIFFSDESNSVSVNTPPGMSVKEKFVQENMMPAVQNVNSGSAYTTETNINILDKKVTSNHSNILCADRTMEEDYCDSEDCEYDDGIISFYNETMIRSMSEQLEKSPQISVHFNKQEALEYPSQNSSKNATTRIYIGNKNETSETLCKKSNIFWLSMTDVSKNCSIYTPKYKPPSKEEILTSLSEFGIPEYRHQEPFVSNILDVTKKKEVGNKTLKINSASVIDLQPFIVNLQEVVGIDTWRKKWLQEFSCTPQGSTRHSFSLDLCSMKPALAGNREVIITPCKLPPSVTEVMLWLKRKELANGQKLPEGKQRVCVEIGSNSRKMVIPLSPGQDCDSDDSLSLTPGSPLTAGSVSFEENVRDTVTAAHSTPAVSSASPQLSVPSSTPILKSKQKYVGTWRMLMNRSRKGLNFNFPNQETISPTLPSIREDDEAVETTIKQNSENDADKSAHTINDSPKSNSISDVYKTAVEKDISTLEAKESIASSSKASISKELLQHQINMILTTPKGVRRMDSSCQIEGSTPNNTYGFRMSLENLQEVKAVSECQFLTTFIMELHIQTRGDLKPDPAYDPIRALFYMVTNDVPEDAGLPKEETGIIIVQDTDHIPSHMGVSSSAKITYVPDELSLLQELVKCVKVWDPDILGGYELEMLSWGYLFQRAFSLQINLYPMVSRVPTARTDSKRAETDNPVNNFTEEIKVTGRIILDIWRLMRHEVALMNYTFQNVMYHILHQRVPLHSFKNLTNWWEHRTHHYRWICIEYYLLKVQGIVKILEQLDLIGRTSELARLFGIQFLEVLSRGSQFRVESMMLRLAKPLNYVPVSPSIQQRAKMRAPEFLPLILEPNSRFYSDPVIVLDFQSLYPSMIIAYNYCFSTCLGRVDNLGQQAPFVFGCTQLKVPSEQLKKLEKNINISPCGVAFVKEGVRKGILPRMLEEILETRLMVKKSMKEHKSNKTLQRVLHSRQLGLKLIANVTYGYTSANFSGRMPCAEVGDSVVSKGRETLERAIHLVERTAKWGAQVVYGDTDSLFVLVPGRSREQAFKIGAEIAEAVTSQNPKPVKLKLEKVYQPCILQTKKRYVGYMYESPDQEKPIYDAKGIETVRRDGCPAVAKILEKSLRLVFETQNMSLVKRYVCRQFEKLLQGRLNIQDLIFAREYRGMSGYRPSACVPAVELTRRWLQTDKRAEPRQGERVPYVIVNGPPGLPLIRLVRSPQELLTDPTLRPNATYYITRVIIPPLERCFSLLGAEVDSWYANMPRKCITNLPTAVPSGLKKSTISQYFATMNCAVCDQLTTAGLCSVCQQQPQKTAIFLANKIRLWERAYNNITKICQSCCGRSEAIDCISLDCPVLFRRIQSSRDLNQAPFIRGLQDQYLTF